MSVGPARKPCCGPDPPVPPVAHGEGCGVYLTATTPCPAGAVDRLVFCNPLCAGTGHLAVCSTHLADALTGQLLT